MLLGRSRLLTVIYLIIGVIVASERNYLQNLDHLERLISAAIAVALWPLLLLGIDVRID